MLLYPVEDIGQEAKGRLNIAKKDRYKGVGQRTRYRKRWVDRTDIDTLKSFKYNLGFRSGYISRNIVSILI